MTLILLLMPLQRQGWRNGPEPVALSLGYNRLRA